MYIKVLKLNNFRNYEELEMTFSEGTNILYGNNAQGKTNILESIYLCGTTKSHRGSKDKEMIRMGFEEAHIRIQILKDSIEHKIDMHLKANKSKGIAIDGIPIKKSAELFSLINVISFSPEDLSMIKNEPGERRRFLNMELCQMDKIYLFHLSNYTKSINQRNALLKQFAYSGGGRDTLQVWDEQLIKSGNKIIEAREKFIEELNSRAAIIHDKLTDGKEKLRLKYEPNVRCDNYRAAMNASYERDVQFKMTNCGPHRDDVAFYIKSVDDDIEKDVRKFGSQGQQRTAALSVKLAEIELVKNKNNDNPIILLDDVLSELDRGRQIQLLDSIKGMQTIITCTGLEEFVNYRIDKDSIYEVSKGNVKQITEQKAFIDNQEE